MAWCGRRTIIGLRILNRLVCGSLRQLVSAAVGGQLPHFCFCSEYNRLTVFAAVERARQSRMASGLPQKKIKLLIANGFSGLRQLACGSAAVWPPPMGGRGSQT